MGRAGGYVPSDAVKVYSQPSPARGWTTVRAVPFSLTYDGNQNAAASGEYLYVSSSAVGQEYAQYTSSTDSWTSGE